MGNRSDRRFANLANPLALEAVVPIRTRRGFHHGPEQITELLTEAVYTNATGFTLIDRAACDRGWGHIRGFESLPLANFIGFFRSEALFYDLNGNGYRPSRNDRLT